MFSKGFTALELVIVIVILSLLTASIIVKNPFSIQDYSSIAADQLIADIRYVQIRAMGMRSTQAIAFRIDASDYGKYDVAGTPKKLPGNLAVTNTSVSNPLAFNSLGEPASTYIIRLSGGREITVYPFTGKAE